MTDDQIRQAFDKWFNTVSMANFDTAFEAGYKAAIASLEPVNDGMETLYRIKEKS